MRKNLFMVFFLSTLLLFTLSGCGQKETPTPIVMVVTEVVEVLVTAVPPSPEPPPEPEESPTIAPFVFTAPPMEVGSTFLYVDDSLLIAVPGGEFIMGHGGTDNPEHIVNLSSFWIYRNAVTNRQYAACVASGVCSPPNLKNNKHFSDPYWVNDPVTGVNHAQAGVYCEEYVTARLPTEAEWEKTARGPDGNIYPWGDSAPSCDLLNIASCVGQTTDVTDYPLGRSYYEGYDFSGNVFEWAADWYSPTYYGESPEEDPYGPEFGKHRSVRSSAYDSDFYQSEVARRYFNDPKTDRDDLGFRCVVEEEHLLDYAPYCERVVVYGVPPSGSPGSGSPPAEICPDLTVNQNSFCAQPGDIPYANLWFQGPPGSWINGVGGCIDLGGSTDTPPGYKYTCGTAASAEICALCEVPIPGDPGCSPGYHLSPGGDVCLPDPTVPGRCLAGYNYDPITQCCQADTPDPGMEPFPHCEVGTYYADPPGACMPFPAAGNICAPITAVLPVCGNHGGDEPGDDPGGCPAQACPNGIWSSDLCCCTGGAGSGCVGSGP